MADEMNKLTAASKGFLQRPEGKVGLVFPVLVTAAVLYFFGSSIGDFLVNAVDNMMHLIIVGTGIALFGWLILDGQLRNLVFYLYRSLMRWLTGLFIDIDPIGVLKTYKERMEGKLGEMKESLDALKGQRVKVVRRQQDNDQKLDNEYRLLEQAKLKGVTNISVHSNQVARLTNMKARYEGDINRLNLLITIMDRYYGLCQDTITDMENEIKYRQDEREYSQQSRSVVRNAMAILKGLPEKDMWDDSMAKLENDYTAAIGEVENFLTMTQGILQQADLQDSADASKAMAMLDAWQAKNAGVTLGGQGNQVTKADIIAEARQIAGVPNTINIPAKPKYSSAVGATLQAPPDDEYGKLFKK